jgi:ornithine cyclodeaminase
VVFDPVTLKPTALVDGSALTSSRTPAVSALAARYVASPEARRLVVLGSGPQAAGHIEAMRAVRPVDDVVIVGRDAQKAKALASRVNARVGAVADVADADLVVCATTAREPLFPGELIREGACVMAIGSHEPDAREIDAGLMLRSRIVVEEAATAARDAGELVLAGIGSESLEPLAQVVRADPWWDRTRPTVVKTVGMAWEDAVVVSAAVRRWVAR